MSIVTHHLERLHHTRAYLPFIVLVFKASVGRCVNMKVPESITVDKSAFTVVVLAVLRASSTLII